MCRTAQACAYGGENCELEEGGGAARTRLVLLILVGARFYVRNLSRRMPSCGRAYDKFLEENINVGQYCYGCLGQKQVEVASRKRKRAVLVQAYTPELAREICC